ncbi:MAG: phosphoribosyltransferase [Promethearchaeota archaeon Loki_b31]|nr:MAG: phosphoribosyltransferase [Candidatus Lokiarchaeota archaeon Loki_b31]
MKFVPYESRIKAGEILADFILENDTTRYNRINKKPDSFISFAIPNGGVPVVEGFCRKLKINYDLIIVRKIKIPYNTEAGFGSVTPDGTVLINNDLLYQLNLSEKQVENAIEITKKEIKERLVFYKKNFDLEETYQNLIKNKIVFMIDDGLASGFTMLAAIKMVKKYDPKEIVISVPTAPLHTIQRIQNAEVKTFCPNIRNTRWFAVADAYKHWYDIPEIEVINYLNKSNFYINNFD